ncbi:MAG: periplasmic heavy metal sensor [Luteitalea sp.]|nr:periplasmic heavy metal sensor [Luteitalea sp.]
MMSNTRTVKMTVVALSTAGVMALGALALAQPGPGGWHGPGSHGHMGGPGVWALRQLDLSDEQRELVRSIREQHRAELQAISEKLQPAREALTAAAMTVPADEAEIQARAADLAAVQTEAAVLHAGIHAEVFQILTPEQQEKAKALHAEWQERRAEFRQRHLERRQSGEHPPQN